MTFFRRIVTSGALACVLSSTANAGGFSLTSRDLTQGKTLPMAQVFNGMGCTGGNLSPQLSWSGAPEGAKSFVLTAYDPDAPTGSGWWHWVMFNIPVSVTSLPTGVTAATVPQGAIESRTDYGTPGFGGACPPPGNKPHRYIFTVTALDVDRLDLDANAGAALVGFMTNAHAIGKATLTVTYGR